MSRFIAYRQLNVCRSEAVFPVSLDDLPGAWTTTPAWRWRFISPLSLIQLFSAGQCSGTISGDAIGSCDRQLRPRIISPAPHRRELRRPSAFQLLRRGASAMRLRGGGR